MRDLTDVEQACLTSLGDAWNLFAALPPAHPSDRDEFVAHLHACQNIVLARPATEEQAKHAGPKRTITLREATEEERAADLAFAQACDGR